MCEQTVSDQNEEFRRMQPNLVRELLALEWSDGIGDACTCGRGKRSHRCLDCFGGPTLCAACVKEGHEHLPFHSIEEWTGVHFQRVTLGELGVRLHLGHCGAACPAVSAATSAAEREGVKMTIAHLNGVHVLQVIPCLCRGARSEVQDLTLQLMRARLFPGTLGRPTSAYTMEMMEHWHIESLQSKKSTWDYWQALWQKTKKGVDRVR